MVNTTVQGSLVTRETIERVKRVKLLPLVCSVFVINWTVLSFNSFLHNSSLKRLKVQSKFFYWKHIIDSCLYARGVIARKYRFTL